MADLTAEEIERMRTMDDAEIRQMMLAKVDKLRSEDAKSEEIKLENVKVGDKGTLCFKFSKQRFPVSLYRDQLQLILDWASDEENQSLIDSALTATESWAKRKGKRS